MKEKGGFEWLVQVRKGCGYRLTIMVYREYVSPPIFMYCIVAKVIVNPLKYIKIKFKTL